LKSDALEQAADARLLQQGTDAGVYTHENAQ